MDEPEDEHIKQRLRDTHREETAAGRAKHGCPEQGIGWAHHGVWDALFLSVQSVVEHVLRRSHVLDSFGAVLKAGGEEQGRRQAQDESRREHTD